MRRKAKEDPKRWVGDEQRNRNQAIFQRPEEERVHKQGPSNGPKKKSIFLRMENKAQSWPTGPFWEKSKAKEVTMVK